VGRPVRSKNPAAAASVSAAARRQAESHLFLRPAEPRIRQLLCRSWEEAMPAEKGIPTEQELAQLPRWARGAFAVRCIARILPLVGNRESTESRMMVCGDIGAGTADPSLVANVIGIAARMQPVVSLTPSETDTPDTYFQTASDAATLAVTSADFSSVNAQSAAINASRLVALIACGLDAVFDQSVPCQARDAAVAAMRWDFELLRDAARLEGWTDETPVSQEFFGQLWPKGAPEGVAIEIAPEDRCRLSITNRTTRLRRVTVNGHDIAVDPYEAISMVSGDGPVEIGKGQRAKYLSPGQQVTIGGVSFYLSKNEAVPSANTIAFEIQVPENASDSDVIQFAKCLAEEADSLHRALGGHGLKIESLEAFGEASVPEEVCQ
jgi:hypothetical protein